MTAARDPARVLAAYVGGFVDALVRSGVRHVCVCPGSRSTPLALAVARHPGARLWLHFDERSAAFFGLGLAKARREPVALVCTSGTAAANFLPAVVEAFHARVPLIALTADRPRELRDCGAAQTIDQVRLYGSHARWFVDLPEPDDSPDLLRHARVVAARAVAAALGPPAGPVHVNCPFREPLIPARLGACPGPPGGSAGPSVNLPHARSDTLSPGGRVGATGEPAPAAILPHADPLPRAEERSDEAASDRPDGRPPVAVTTGRRVLSAVEVGALAEELGSCERGLIVCGPQDDPGLADAVAELAARLGFPILADPLSGLRRGPHDRSLVLDGYDAFLRDPATVGRLAPDIVLRFGATPTSKPLAQFLERHARSPQLVVDGGGGWDEPSHRAARIVHADGRLLGEALAARFGAVGRRGDPAGGRWAASWRRANDLACGVIRARLAELGELFEGKVFAELADLLPEGALLYAGNSMPVRDLDSFFPAGGRALRFLANRGGNGIDGVVSSALGASASGARPVVLVIGDLSFYHDSNGLLAARRHGLTLTIVLLNNDGGGIFSFLPQADEVEEFEELFGTPHGLDFRPLAEAYGARFHGVASWDDFRAVTARGIAGEGLTIVEVPTERGRNALLHRRIWREVSAALARDGERA